jgi:CHAT domain-containing protein
MDTYQNLSQIYSYVSDSANAFLYLEKAKDIVYLQSDNIVQLASINARYADSYSRLGHYNIAEKYYQEALDLLNENDHLHQIELAELYKQKGRLSYYLGKFTNSIALYSKSLHFLDLINASSFDKINSFEQLADVYYLLKDYDKALQMYLKSYTILIDHLPKDHHRIIDLHTDIATAYKGLEDYEKAIEHFRIAASNRTLSPYQYRVFGETLWKANRFEEAEVLLKKANAYAESREVKDEKEVADTHFWLGSFYLQTGRDKLLGLYYLNLAVGEYRAILGDKNEPLGRALLAQAKYFAVENNTEKALEIIQSSIIALTPGFYSENPLVNPDGLQLSMQSVANSLGWKARTLAQHYDKMKDIKYLKASFDTYQLSLKLVEGFRLTQKYSSNLILNKEVNNLLDQAIQVSHKLYLLTDESRYFEATFSFIEQNKSTALLASLQRNDSIHLSNVPVELIEKENNLKQSLLSLEEKTGQLVLSSSNPDQNLKLAYLKQKQAFKNSLDSLQNILSSDYPEYYRLFYGNNVIGISDVQKQLSRNKVLIDYAITDSLLLVYVISKDQADVYSKKMPVGFDNSILRLLQLIRHVNTDNSYADYQSFINLAQENYQFLLGDFAESLKGKELFIVPDGILSYLPFEVLLTDSVVKEQPDYRSLPYFINNNVCSTLNSAAIYFSYSQKKKPNYGQIIAFAPNYSIFERSDTTSRGDYVLMPLPHVKRELESISFFFKPEIFKGEKATKAKFKANAPKASVLHLAMHTVLNDDNPLQSQLVFAADDESSSGAFTVGELFGMDLSADLAVLSACNSGNGKLNKGEGIMSLSTGFQYAGVPSVIMTHWDVNDKYSADLMAGLYTYLAKGLEKNVALHNTKLDMINNGSTIYSHPYYWAGFTLIGNETAIVSRKSNFGKSLEYWIPILIILALIFRRKKEKNG